MGHSGWPSEMLQPLVDHMAEAAALLTPEGRLLAANPALSRISGYNAEKLCAGSLSLLFSDPGADTRLRVLLSRAGREGAVEGKARATRRDGSPLWLRFRLIRLAPREAGEPAGRSPDFWLLALAEEITHAERRPLRPASASQRPTAATVHETALTRRYRELAALNELASTVNQSLDLQTVLETALDRALEVAEAGMGWVRLLSPTERGVLELVADRGLPYEYVHDHRRVPMGDCLAGKVVATGKPLVLYSLPPDDDLTPYLRERRIRCVAKIPLRHRDHAIGALGIGSARIRQFPEGLVRFLTAVGEQVGLAIEHARLYEQVRQRAEMDPLTGLLNRQRFCELLDGWLAGDCGLRRPEGTRDCGFPGGVRTAAGLSLTSPLSDNPQSRVPSGRRNPQSTAPWVLMLDIDNFKQINDDSGHHQGDLVLREVAAFLRQGLRIGDLVARYGGDEFVAALRLDGGAEDASTAAEPEVVSRLRDRFAAAGREGRFASPVQVSIGCARATASSEHSLRLADAAMYREKRGRLEGRRQEHRHRPTT